MKEVKVSTKYASTVRIKSTTIVMQLNKVDELKVYVGAGKFIYIPVNNDKDEFVFEYDETEFWKTYSKTNKEIRKKGKKK